MSFLFFTGGTAQVPIVSYKTYEAMGRTARTVVAMPEECTLNVARGAALYYDYRVTGVLRCGVDVVGREPETGKELFREHVCAPGALPGPELERAVRLGARQTVEVALEAAYPDGGPRGRIAARLVENKAPEPRQVVVMTRYGADHKLYWRLSFAEAEVVVAEEVVMGV